MHTDPIKACVVCPMITGDLQNNAVTIKLRSAFLCQMGLAGTPRKKAEYSRDLASSLELKVNVHAS
jgi:hypothetical protein